MRLYLYQRKEWFYARGTKPDGNPIEQSLGTKDSRKAKEALSKLENTLWKADIYGVKAVVTFDQAAVKYVEDGGDARFIVKVTELLSDVRLADITPFDVRATAKKAYPNGSPATRNRQGITPIQAVINYAHEQGWCPPITVKRFEVKKPDRKAVGIEYLLALKQHAPVNLFALMLFLHTTGRRVGDAIALKPDDLDLGIASAYIKDPKNGEPVTVKLVPFLVEIIKDLETHNGRVFGYRDRRNLYDTLKRSCERAGIEYLGTHQVGRHSFATELANRRWTSKRIADAGGWKSVRLVDDTYIHTNDPAEEATDLIWEKYGKKFKGTK